MHQSLLHDVRHEVSAAAQIPLLRPRDEETQVVLAKVPQPHQPELPLLLLLLLLLLLELRVLVGVGPEVLGVLVLVLDVLLEDLAPVDGGGAAVAALNAVGGTGSGNLVK